MSLEENLRRIETDTSYQTFAGDLGLHEQAVKLRNQAFNDSFADYLKYALVLPIEAVYDTATRQLLEDIEGKETHRMTYKFFDNTVSEYYKTKQACLKNIRIIHLPNE